MTMRKVVYYLVGVPVGYIMFDVAPGIVILATAVKLTWEFFTTYERGNK